MLTVPIKLIEQRKLNNQLNTGTNLIETVYILNSKLLISGSENVLLSANRNRSPVLPQKPATSPRRWSVESNLYLNSRVLKFPLDITKVIATILKFFFTMRPSDQILHQKGNLMRMLILSPAGYVLLFVVIYLACIKTVTVFDINIHLWCVKIQKTKCPLWFTFFLKRF